jgi:DNA-directed RNA polymerase I subunit RPA2
MSKNCHLRKLSPTELIDKKEDCTEFGGYFIVNGIEKLLRMLVIPKRNYPIAFARSKFAQREANFTQYAVSMRCVRKDIYA